MDTRDLPLQVPLEVLLLVADALLVDVDARQFVLLQVARVGDAHGCQSNFLLVLLVLHLLHEPLLLALRTLRLLQLDSLL